MHQKDYHLSLQAHQSEPQTAATFSQGKRLQPVNTVRWYYRTFQGAPDLVRELLPGSAAAANALGFDTAAAAGAAGSHAYLQLRRTGTPCGRGRQK